MAWEKRGLVIEPPVHLPWAHSHAAIPFVDVDAPDGPLAYFTTRDERGRSQIARARLSWDGERLSAAVESEPVLQPGRPGCFDDAGAMMSCLVRHEGREHLYYQGWTLGVSVPFYVFGGLAVSEDGGATFERVSEAPILGRCPAEPITIASPWVLLDEGRWRMWYVSCTGWSEPPDPHYHVHLRYAESDDGVDWRLDGADAVRCEGDEYALGRPCVVRDGDLYRMWYAYRGERYRIGYAESGDGLSWTRRDAEAGIEPSAEGWDSEMVEYAAVFDAWGERFMLYNGNGFGRTGIGYALLAG